MAEKKGKTCRKCGHRYVGRYCQNKSCVAHVTGKAKAKASRRRRGGSKGKSMHFGQLSAPIAPASSPVAGQGGTLPVNPSAVPEPVKDAEYELTHMPLSSDPVNREWIADCNEHNKQAFAYRRMNPDWRTNVS
jgi:hypothetical protein